MPDTLYISRDPQSGFLVERAITAAGQRVKMTHDVRLACSWLSLRAFDAIVIDADWGIDVIRRILNEGRDGSPSSPVFLVGSPEHRSKEEKTLFLQELALRGIEQVELEQLTEKLKTFATLRDKAAGTPFRILVVEDLDAPRDIICHFIEKFGNAVVTGVSSAKEALATLAASPGAFDCIMTDMNMPEVSGSMLLEQLRKHPELQKLPVIVLTAYGTPENLVRCLKAGASGFLVKPPKKAELQRELGRARRIAGGEIAPRMATYAEADAIEQLLIELGYA